MEKTNITIIGAGVIGLSTAYELSSRSSNIIILEKNNFFGQETSSRNSEVIHAGIYYPKNSLKAQTCIRGKELLYKFCEDYNIPFKKLGKLVVGSDKKEIEELVKIHKNASGCGLNNLKFLSKHEISKLEPDINSKEALWSPDTGIIDSHSLMKFFHDKAKNNGVEIAFGIKVVGIEKNKNEYIVTVQEPSGEYYYFSSNIIINAAGFLSDKIAGLVGIDIKKNNYQINYSKGQYFRISNPQKFNIKHLIYPPPTSIDLGIHITPDLSGGLRLGPDSKYVPEIDYEVDLHEKEKFFKSVNRYLKNLELADLTLDTAGIRPKLQGENEGFRDFIISNEIDKGFENFINCIGIESPGLTSCLAIAEKIKSLIHF